jgi:hypothetical protein
VATLREKANGDWVLEEGTLVVTRVAGQSELQILADDAAGRRWDFTLGAGVADSSLERLIGQKVVQVVAVAAGTLRLRFSDGTELSVSPHDDAEAWEIRCDEDPLLVGAPGGGVFAL